MIGKFVLKRNRFIASIVRDYTDVMESVLDLGCGEGTLLKYLGIPVYYHGVDINYHGNSQIIENSDITTWTTHHMYDTVVVQEVLEHLSLPDSESISLLEKIKGFMYNDSILIISVPNYNRLTNRIFKPKYLDKTHNIEYLDGQLDTILERLGYSIIKKHYWLLYLPFEKQIGWLFPEWLRSFVLKHHPTWSSHFIYIVRKDNK